MFRNSLHLLYLILWIHQHHSNLVVITLYNRDYAGKPTSDAVADLMLGSAYDNDLIRSIGSWM
jgi:hypothetical protein